MHHHEFQVIAIICLLAAASQWLAWRIKIPSIVLLLVCGILAGPVTGWVNPEEFLGHLLVPFVSTAVAIILFEGSLTLEFHEIRQHGRVVTNLITTGTLITWVLVALAAHWLADLAWPLAILFGAVMVVTGPTVIVPMLRTVRPKKEVASILRWEGILIDPVGAILALLTFNAIVANQFSTALGDTLLTLTKLIVIGSVIGIAAGAALAEAIKRFWIPDYLQNALILLFVILVYSGADLLQSETGFLAVTVMGIWLANSRKIEVERIIRFKESLSILLISVLFILLAARLNLTELIGLGASTIVLVAFIQFVVRPANILASTVGSSLSVKEKILLSWIAPRGIVAAAVSAVFALRLEEQGFEQAGLLVPLAFAVIIGTVLWQSFTAAPLARALGASEPAPNGVLIIGANLTARVLAEQLHESGFDVLVADNQRRGIRKARMQGLPTYFGNPMSEHASVHMPLAGIGKVVALSRRPEFNALACSHFQHEFGSDSVFSLAGSPRDDTDRHDAGAGLRGRNLFSADANVLDLRQAIQAGGEVRVTSLTEEFDFAAFKAKHGDAATPLFAWDENGDLQPFTEDAELEPGDGWQVMSLFRAD